MHEARGRGIDSIVVRHILEDTCGASFCVIMSFLLVLLCFSVVRGVASYSFEETFDEGWEKRWVASTDAKYTGTFTVDTLKPDVALKVKTP